MASYNAGIVTAYGAAVRGGYTGTYEQFCAQQANYAASAAAVEQAKTDAQAAAQAAEAAAETFSVDLALNATSTHPVQNQVVAQAINTVNNAIGDPNGETVTPTATNNYGVGGNVGQVIETWATTEYWHGIYTVSAGNTYGITTVSDFPQQLVVWFTNASNTIIENHKAFATDHVEMVCTAPTGATKLFVMSYGYDAYHGTVQKVEPLSETVSNLKDDIRDVYIPSENLHNPATDRHGININGSGVITEDTSYKASDYIYVGAGNKVTIQVDPKQQRIYFYKTNDESGFSRALWITGTGSQTFTLSSIENYIVITMLETLPDFMVNIGDTLLPYAPYGGSAGVFLQDTLDGVEAMVNAELENVPKKDIINRFDKSTITSGCYLATSDGTLVNEDSFFASDYIDVSDLENIKCSYTHIVCFYDVQKVFISGQSFNTNNEDNSIQRPENAVYMRFSNYLTKLNDSQIGKDVSRSNYSPYGKYTLPDLIESENIIIVDANGNGDYTSLTQALYDNVNSGVNIKVLPGVYNIVSEYVSIFGQSAVDNMADSDSATFKGFQYGAIIRNRKITFEPGSHIICDWTGHTVDGTHRFSALRVDYNCELIGLDLVATGTFYAIHDDYGFDDIPYTVKYENCRVEGVNLTNANCIGGGCQKYSKHILKNCYFNNNLTNSATVRYHNTNDDGAEPEIYVSNCYFNNWFTPRWYGSQTSKMKVYVNNCEARSIHKLAESSSFNVDNVDLYKWCNTETSPVT